MFFVLLLIYISVVVQLIDNLKVVLVRLETKGEEETEVEEDEKKTCEFCVSISHYKQFNRQAIEYI